MQFTRQNIKENGSSSPNRRKLYFALALSGVFLAGFLFLRNDKDPSTRQREPESPSGVIESGTIEGIPFYACQSTDRHLVLLHGARFTKEDWKTSNILSLFCDHLSVTALDLSVTAEYDQLLSVLKALKKENIIKGFPIAGLVTPSASGSTVIDGLVQSKIELLQQHIHTWVPVATNGVLSVPPEKLKTNQWDILAIYGDQDGLGKKSSQVWQMVGNAKVVELPGSHPVYLDVPDEFVNVVVSHLSYR